MLPRVVWQNGCGSCPGHTGHVARGRVGRAHAGPSNLEPPQFTVHDASPCRCPHRGRLSPRRVFVYPCAKPPGARQEGARAPVSSSCPGSAAVRPLAAAPSPAPAPQGPGSRPRAEACAHRRLPLRRHRALPRCAGTVPCSISRSISDRRIRTARPRRTAPRRRCPTQARTVNTLSASSWAACRMVKSDAA